MKNSMKNPITLKLLLLITLIMNGTTAFSQKDTLERAELAAISRALDNPLAKMWSLVFQENAATNQGNLVDGSVFSNTFFFQPALPIPFGKNKVFTARPVLPLVTTPNIALDPTGKTRTTGFGDIQMAALAGPGKATGWVWGGGPTFVFPTASSKEFGKGKYQMGPAFMLFHLSKKWTKGLFIQQWWSYAGHSDRDDVSKMDIQYVFRRNLGTVSIGLGPTVSIDWTKDGKNAVTFPIGLGVTKTIKMGNTPFKLRFEPQYSIVSPDDYGNVWNIRIQIVPVIKSPFLN